MTRYGTSIVTRTELSCLSCGRSPGYVQEGFVRLADPSHRESVDRLDCPACIGGRLVTGEVYSALVPRPLSTDRCGCGNVVAAGEARYCAPCVQRRRALEAARKTRERRQEVQA